MPTQRLGLEAVTFGDKVYIIGGKFSQNGEIVTQVNEIFQLLGS